MALQLARTSPNKFFNPLVNVVRNRSRSSLPSLLWEDPFKHQRSLFADIWNRPDPFDTFFAPTRYNVFRVPSSLRWEGEQNLTNPKDGFQVALNVQNFEPHEVTVKVIDNSIIVEAKHEERSDGDESYVSRHFSRRYVLPDEYNINDVVSTLSSDGILTVKAPPKHLEEKNARNVQIQQTGAAHQNPEEPKKVEEKKSDESSN